MKNLKKIFVAILAMVLCIGAMHTLAAEQTGEYEYEVIEGTDSIRITAYNGKETNVTIPSEIDGYTVLELGKKAFADNGNIVSVVIPENIRTIGKNAFFRCYALKTVILNEGLETIEIGAFCYCTSLKNITLPDTVTTIGPGAFSYTSSLETINIPAGVTRLYSYCFESMTALKSIYIPSTVKYIEAGAFHYCINLIDISIEDGVQYIEWNAFATAPYCDNHNNKWVDGALYIDNYLIRICDDFLSNSTYIVKEGTYLIAEGAMFSNPNNKLEKLIIPESVKYINEEVLDLYTNVAVYYYGTEEQWNKVFVSTNNPDSLLDPIIGAIEGDLNGDMEINARDSILMRKYLTGALDPSKLASHTLDVNGDGKFNAKDQLTLRKLLGV